LDKFRAKRNINDYEKAYITSEKEAQEMLALAHKLRGEFENWLRTRHPELIAEKSSK